MESEVQGVPFLDSSKFLREVFLRAWKPFLIHKIFGTVFESGANKNLTWINSGSKAFYNGFTMDQIYIVRGAPTFGAVKYVKEQSHVNHVHANSLLIHLNFSSKLMIIRLNFIVNRLLIRFQTDLKLTFDPLRTNEGGSKVSFRWNWVVWSLMSKRNSGGSKLSWHTYGSREYLLHILYWIKSWTPAYFYIFLFWIKVFSLSLTSD